MKYLLFLITILFNSCTPQSTVEFVKPTSIEDFAKTAVMLFNTDQTTGGSGVILRSDKDNSYILTNRHVCSILRNGGSVFANSVYPVIAYKTSKVHDICIAKVKANLNVNTVLAQKAPKLYSKAFVSGHPNLYPYIFTSGHFSGKIKIEVISDTRECTKEEFAVNPVECLFDGFPITENLEAQLVSATIMPGSSGSAVFDENGAIAGLAFASNSHQLSYALVVPWEYLHDFIYKEIKTVKWTVPKTVTFPTKVKLKNNLDDRVYTQPFGERTDRMYDIKTWKKLLEYINGKNKNVKKTSN